MLERVRPDVVHITTPPQSHFKLAMDALAAGAHVIVEKPITAVHDQVPLLLRSASELKRTLVEDYNYIFNALWLQQIAWAWCGRGSSARVVDMEVE